MADTVDLAAAIEAETLAIGVARAVQPIAAGVAGECEECEWWMPRLVDGRCAFCRDGRQRPPDWEPPIRPDQPTATPAAPLPAPSETTIMPSTSGSKSIMLPASAATAITAVEQLARMEELSLGAAAATLIERGAQAPLPSATPPAPPTFDDLLDQLRERFAEQEQQSVDAAIADVTARAEAAEARATAAEAKFEQARALFA